MTIVWTAQRQRCPYQNMYAWLAMQLVGVLESRHTAIVLTEMSRAKMASSTMKPGVKTKCWLEADVDLY